MYHISGFIMTKQSQINENTAITKNVTPVVTLFTILQKILIRKVVGFIK